MEVSAPVTQQIVTVMQGRKKTDLVFTSRADCRALIAQVALAMEELPDDGDDVVDATVYCGERAPWGEECTLEDSHELPCIDTKDREWWPAACPSCGKRRKHADDCKRMAKLAELGEQIAVLSQPAEPEAAPGCESYSLKGDGCVITESHWLHRARTGYTWLSPESDLGGPEGPAPEPEWDGDPKCGARHPELGDGCEAHRRGFHVAPGREEGDPDIEWPIAPLAKVTRLHPASVTRIVDGEPVEVHLRARASTSDTQYPCVGLALPRAALQPTTSTAPSGFRPERS